MENRTKLIRYCIGVDVLGFNMYVYHEIGY